jgi:hypothetical protein
MVWFPPVSVARRHPRPGIVYREVSDLAPSTLCVAWPRDARSPAVAAFVRAATDLAAATAATATEAATAVVAASRPAAPVSHPG